jgi:anti-sigma regulatory factor (Ser/Thr protein kinase)
MTAALPIDARSVAAARRLLHTALNGYQPSTIEDAVLMISELVTNAVRHAHAVLLVLITIHHPDTAR